MDKFSYVVPCASGIEDVVAAELSRLGGENITVDSGAALCSGSLEFGYRCCLWSRFGSRVLLKLHSFPIWDEQSLYDQSRQMAWDEHLLCSNSFAINCTADRNSPINHTRFAALRVKDSIVDMFRDQTGDRPSVDANHPDLQFHVHLTADRATIYLDLSGESLHRRGYRVDTGTAPLKETLAAAIVALSGWPENPQTLIDPMCGSATLLIEAALIYGDSAPGLSRKYFGFFGWLQHNPTLWDKLVEEALDREAAGMEKEWPLLLGYDSDPLSVRAARRNIESAGLETKIRIQRQELARLVHPGQSEPDQRDEDASSVNVPSAPVAPVVPLETVPTTGLVLSNLPYGERLLEKEQAARLYRAFGRILQSSFPGWRCGVFISQPELTDSFRLDWSEKYKLFNGPIACRLLTTTVKPQEDDFVWSKPLANVTDEKGNEFINRLRKNAKKMFPWASREGIRCFRLYDRDLPDFNLSIDVYEKWLLVQEYAAPSSIDEKLARSRFQQAVRNTRELFGLRSDRVFLKTRERQRGSNQYKKSGSSGKLYEVREGECWFLVNFTDYLDSGLFLDHRPIRQQIFEQSSTRRFLNLFAYTGTASVHAAMGGAASTTTVDLSANYLARAKQNFALNGLAFERNSFVQADCLQWLSECRDEFDLIFIDPPTFSNTKKERRVFDVQRDHGRLIELAMQRLSNNGVVLFSTNYRRFMLDQGVCEKYKVEDISKKTVPYDFARSPKIHKCWEIRR